MYKVNWKTGNQGRCIDLVDCPGKNQEHFVTCSDIRIKGNGGGNGGGNGNGNGGGNENGEEKGKIIIDRVNMQV